MRRRQCGQSALDESCVPPQAVDQTEYVVSFDDETLERKRAAGDDVLYIDARQQGSNDAARKRLLDDGG